MFLALTAFSYQHSVGNFFSSTAPPHCTCCGKFQAAFFSCFDSHPHQVHGLSICCSSNVCTRKSQTQFYRVESVGGSKNIFNLELNNCIPFLSLSVIRNEPYLTTLPNVHQRCGEEGNLVEKSIAHACGISVHQIVFVCALFTDPNLLLFFSRFRLNYFFVVVFRIYRH